MRRTRAAVLCCLLVLAAAACTKDVHKVGSNSVTTDVTTSTAPPAPATTRAPVGAKARLSLRPVLSVQACPTGTATGSTLATPVTGRPDLVPALGGTLCYGLGPVAATGADMEKAVLRPGSGTWAVTARAVAASVGQLDVLFNACLHGEPFCSTPNPSSTSNGAGRLATVLDHAVVSVATMTTAREAAVEFDLATGLTRAQADELVAIING